MSGSEIQQNVPDPRIDTPTPHVVSPADHAPAAVQPVVDPADYATSRMELFPSRLTKRTANGTFPEDRAWIGLVLELQAAGMGAACACVYQQMIWRANDKLQFPVSLSLLATDTGLSREEVHRHVKNLKAVGIIQSVEAERGRAKSFKFVRHEKALHLVKASSLWSRKKRG